MATWYTSGTCSRKIDFEIKNNKISYINFEGGCPGNLHGLSNMVKGMEIDEVIERLRGITCGMKPTSCPDQLALALISWKSSED